MDPNNPDTNADTNADNNKMMGGRRKGSKTRKEPKVLKSWRKFVRKVQHEEHLTYPKAMKRASQRKSEWQRGGATDGADSMAPKMGANNMGANNMGANNMGASMAPKMGTPGMAPKMGGRRRRSRKQRGGDEGEEEGDMGDEKMTPPPASMGGRRRRSRRQRGGNAPASAPASVADFDSDWKQYGSVGGSRKRRYRR